MPPDQGDQYAVLIMFDDGRADNYTTALPLLQARDIKATIYTNPSRHGTAGYITDAQAVEMDEYGIDIGNHTHTHQNLTSLNAAQQEAEFTNAKNALDAIGLTRAGMHVAYPFCAFDANTMTAMAAAGMLTGRTCATGHESFVEVHDNWGLYRLPVQVYPLAATTLAEVTAEIDFAKAHNEKIAILLHSIKETPADDYDWSTENFTGLLDHIQSIGMPTMTITEYYAAYQAAYP